MLLQNRLFRLRRIRRHVCGDVFHLPQVEVECPMNHVFSGDGVGIGAR